MLAIQNYIVGWITALDVEHAAAVELLDEKHKQPSPVESDPTIYTPGRMGDHNVVIACLPSGVSGLASAATVAARLAQRFPAVKIRLMVGIGGGVPSNDNDIRLGDVVVSQPKDGHGGVIQYDFGKAVSDGSYQRTSHLNKPPALLLHALSQVRSNHIQRSKKYTSFLAKLEENSNFAREGAGADQLFNSTYLHVSGSTCTGCDKQRLIEREIRSPQKLVQIHYGTIASANTLMKDALERDRICQDLGGGVLCFEMEAAGLMNDFPCLVIRGICDYADSHKNDKWQPYAAATAAAYAKEILSVIPVLDVAKLNPLKGMLQFKGPPSLPSCQHQMVLEETSEFG